MMKKIPALAVSFMAACAFVSARPQQASGSGTSSASSAKSGSSSAAGSSKKKTSSKKHHAKREPTQKAPTPDRIVEIQSALARSGYYQGQPNGKWDGNTVAAMQKFQSDSGLDATGKLDALSLQKLGLGSSVAGVSAPKPPVPATETPSNPAPASPPAKPSAESSGGAAQSASSAAPATKQQ